MGEIDLAARLEMINPPTKEQLAELRVLGVQFDAGTLDYVGARFLIIAAMQEKPGSGWRLDKLRRWGLLGELPVNPSMEDVAHLLSSVKYEAPTPTQIRAVKELGFKIRGRSEMTAEGLDEFLTLQGQPPREEELEIFRGWGVAYSSGDALASYAMRLLIGYFIDLAGLALKHYETYAYSDAAKIAKAREIITPACIAALSDPDYEKPTVAVDDYGRVILIWPRRKIKEWYRQGIQLRSP